MAVNSNNDRVIAFPFVAFFFTFALDDAILNVALSDLNDLTYLYIREEYL